jgi:hypothetical protein
MVGFTLDWHFAGNDSLWAAFSPILDKEVAHEKPTFTITQNETFGIAFHTDSGFHYSAEPSKVVVGFQHRLSPLRVNSSHLLR